MSPAFNPLEIFLFQRMTSAYLPMNLKSPSLFDPPTFNTPVGGIDLELYFTQLCRSRGRAAAIIH
ncbi:hypothetical protein HI914_02004 [Erysiphe necator]|nr:hypothetical protein HI914_02004 [Erysiphe necator]